MKISRKELKRLIENYLLREEGMREEEVEEEAEEESAIADEELPVDEPVDDEELADEEPVDDTAEDSGNSAEASTDEPKEDKVQTSDLISNSLEPVLEKIKNKMFVPALQDLEDLFNGALKGIETKVKDVPEDILDILLIPDETRKNKENIIKIKPSPGAKRKGIADQQK